MEKTKTLCHRLFGSCCFASLAVGAGAAAYAGWHLNNYGTNNSEISGGLALMLFAGVGTLVASVSAVGCTVSSVYEYCKS